jgi:hypothetical protein|tara:strand:- start:1607 stop:3298 length:1692 start_codon:yes stop_codon:yes gene_type:complete
MIANTLLNCALWVRMQILRWTHWRPFVHAAKHPGQIQRALLQQLLRRNTATRFGREHRLNTVSNYDDFIGAVPVQTYETLRPYIEDQEQTGEPALNIAQPVMYAKTSGTTGQAKLIPILPATLQEHKRSQAIQSYVQFTTEPRAYYGRCVAIVSPAEEGTLDTGTPYGSTSGFMYQNMPRLAKVKYVLPYQVFEIEDYDLKYLLILRLGIAYRDVTHLACANPSTLVKLLAVLAANRTSLLRDLTKQTFSRIDELPVDVQAVIRPRLSCTPRRVTELQTILTLPQPTFADLWPELQMVSTWTGGSCGIPLTRVRPTLPPTARVAELGYLASELRGTLMVDLKRNVGIPTIHENFFEFVERDDWDAGRQAFLTIDQLTEGKEYYIFPTTATGLYRYFMNDIVRVTGLFYNTPTIEFVQKGKGVTNITGEKLYESQVIAAVRTAEDATGFVSGFFLMLADAVQERYRLVVECATPTDNWAQQTVESVERHLMAGNVEYAAKRASGRLQPLELLPVRSGTGDAYKQHCLQQGQREGQFKLIALQYQADCPFPFAEFRVDLTTHSVD